MLVTHLRSAHVLMVHQDPAELNVDLVVGSLVSWWLDDVGVERVESGCELISLRFDPDSFGAATFTRWMARGSELDVTVELCGETEHCWLLSATLACGAETLLYDAGGLR